MELRLTASVEVVKPAQRRGDPFRWEISVRLPQLGSDLNARLIAHQLARWGPGKDSIAVLVIVADLRVRERRDVRPDATHLVIAEVDPILWTGFRHS